MPRRRPRKTNRVPQGQRHLRVRGMRRSTPDAQKLSRAFIGLAMARAEAEAEAQDQAAANPSPSTAITRSDGGDPEVDQ